MARPQRIALVSILALAAAAGAFAASLALSAGSLAMASVSTPRCTTAGLSVIENVSASTVISVTVSNLPAGCGNATLQVTLNNQVTSSSGSTTVPAGGGSATATLAVAVPLSASAEADLVLTGP